MASESTTSSLGTIKGPAIFLAQFMGQEAPFDTLENMAKWAASQGYKGIQVPTDPKLFDLEKAAESQQYCDDIAQVCRQAGVEITELSTHLQGQLVACELNRLPPAALVH